MLIGILSDIHGNSHALKAVLAEAKRLHLVHLLVLGDMVGYYYESKEVFEMLGEWQSKTIIRGNHEDFLTGILDGSVNKDEILMTYGSSINIALDTLSDGILGEIKDLRSSEAFSVDGINIRICHGSPWDVNQYIYPDSDASLLARCDAEGNDYVFLGHTHYPFIHFGKHSLVANPGSIGQSRVHGGIADWAILDTRRRVYVSKQTKYDVEQIRDAVKKIDPHLPYLHKILER